MGNTLNNAKKAKNDEFYTEFHDIETEINAYVEYNPDVFRDKTILLPCDDPEWSEFTRYFASNFEKYGIKKLISTSYAKSSGSKQLTMFEMMSPNYDADKHDTHGKLFTLTRDADGSGNVDIDDIEFNGYLEGDGDFRSAEVTALRDESDIIITNPPFSIFTQFLKWIMDGGKSFIILGNMNDVTSKDIFPYFQKDDVWLGYSYPKEFRIPELTPDRKNTYVREDGTIMATFGNMCWYANIEHGLHHQPLKLDTMAHNLKFNTKLKNKLESKFGVKEYPKYDNFDAIEVPFIECIPSDYYGLMGVPISYMAKSDLEQFEVVGTSADLAVSFRDSKGKLCSGRFYVNGKRLYERIVIRRKEQ